MGAYLHLANVCISHAQHIKNPVVFSSASEMSDFYTNSRSWIHPTLISNPSHKSANLQRSIRLASHAMNLAPIMLTLRP
jgi:hypothetical protein